MEKKVQEVILDRTHQNLVNGLPDLRCLCLDSSSYFELKIDVFGSPEKALEVELHDYMGLKVFHNNMDYQYLDVV